MGLYYGQLEGNRPYINVELLKADADPIVLKALIDTGADHSHAADSILRERGAAYIQDMTIDTHDVRELSAQAYRQNVLFPRSVDGTQGLSLNIAVINTQAMAAPMIIGMSAIKMFDFSIRRDGTFILEW